MTRLHSPSVTAAGGDVTTHEAAADPHPGYLTAAEGSAAYLPKTVGGAQVFRSTVQSIPAVTNTALLFTSEAFDSGGFHDNTTNPDRLTVPAGMAGVYLVVAQTTFRNMADQKPVYLSIWLNGATTNFRDADQASGSGVFPTVVATGVLSLAVGDYLQAVALHEDTVARDAGANETRFALARIGVL